MADIIERLRKWYVLPGGGQTAGLYLEAANEIERLRGALEAWKNPVGAWSGRAVDLGAENERLREEVEVLRGDHGRWSQEVGRLRDALRPFAEYAEVDVWRGTSWDGLSGDDAVLYSHATDKKITLEDFWRAKGALTTGKHDG